MGGSHGSTLAMRIGAIVDLTVGPIPQNGHSELGSLGSGENSKIVVLRASVQPFFDLRPLLGIVFQGESDSEGPGVVWNTF